VLTIVNTNGFAPSATDDIAGGDVFDFAIDLFSAWGVGQARNDNGLGILLVKDRREIRFVTGGGLEGVLPDAICKRIQLKYMLPAFRQGDYSLGMVQGVEAVSQLLEGSELDLGGTDTAGDELPAWGQRTRDDQWFESSPAQVYGRGISGRAGSDNNHISQITHIPTVANHQSNQPRTARFHAFLFLMAYYQVLSKPDHRQSFT